MSIEAAAREMNEQGWTCQYHEPKPFKFCELCVKIQTAAVEKIVAACAGDRVLYELDRSRLGILRLAAQRDGSPGLWPTGDQLIEGGILVQVYPEPTDE